MDSKVQLLLEKAKLFADKTGKAAVRAADTAGKKANEVAQATRVNLQIFDLNTECGALYKELGKMMYDAHIGIETPNEVMEETLQRLDENRAKVQELKSKLSDADMQTVCSVCGKPCAQGDVYCSSCGAQI